MAGQDIRKLEQDSRAAGAIVRAGDRGVRPSGSMSAVGRVSQWATRRIRRAASGRNRAKTLVIRSSVPSACVNPSTVCWNGWMRG
jgi:hypothetical protein